MPSKKPVRTDDQVVLEDKNLIKAPHKYNSTMVYKLFTMEPFCWHIDQIARLTDYQIDKYYLKPGKEISEEYERKKKGGGDNSGGGSGGDFSQISLSEYLNLKRRGLGDKFDESYWTQKYKQEFPDE